MLLVAGGDSPLGWAVGVIGAAAQAILCPSRALEDGGYAYIGFDV